MPSPFAIYCGHCGRQNPAENTFCGTCGRALYPPGSAIAPPQHVAGVRPSPSLQRAGMVTLWVWVTLGLAVGVFVVAALFYMMGYQP